ncbi:MAG: MerR family transcriptional regulator [Chloroflexi bacterium]|nr:MerR family transcriptional regulator [Chloroflexota bacterium]
MFRIGEFSKIAQVPGSLLRYYDQIGLIKPDHIDKWTGYRYYSARQLPQLHRILALKELGLTLDQIARLVDEEISTEEIRGMLTLKKAQIEQTLHEEVVRLRHIEARLQQIDATHQPAFDIVIKNVSAQQYLSVREVLPNPVRVGGFENNCQSYGAIGLWVEDNGYRIAGPGREVLIQPPRTDNLDEMVTEIQFPVEPAGDALPI